MRLDRGWLQGRSQANPMSRRSFGRVLTGLVVGASHMATAQDQTVIRRIARLTSGAPETPAEIWKSDEALRNLGWVEGQNLQIERRYANGRFDTLQTLAEELVRAKVEVIVTGGTPATLAAKHAMAKIPIVFRAGDPVLLGLVASLARPGGNVTGLSLAGPEVAAKYLSLLKDLLPGLRRIGVLETSANP